MFVCTLGSARGCPGSTCISPVWLERCNTLSPLSQARAAAAHEKSHGLAGAGLPLLLIWMRSVPTGPTVGAAEGPLLVTSVAPP